VPHLSPPNGSFWWKDILKLHDKLCEVSAYFPGMGDTVGLWVDQFQDQALSLKYPNLFEAVLNRNLPLKEALHMGDLLNLFRLPMTRVAYNEFVAFRGEIEILRSEIIETDVWVCNWNGGLYSSRNYYKHIFRELDPPHLYAGTGKVSVCP